MTELAPRLRLSILTRVARTLLIFLAALSLVAVLGPTRAQAASSSLKLPGGGQVLVDAKNLSRDYDTGTLELSGDVRMIYNQQYLSCDRAVINEKTRTVQAVGNVIISSPQAYVEGESAVLNYGDNTGVIQHGFVKSGQVIFEGEVVRKTGPISYEAEKSYYTACTTCPTAWSFKGKRMQADIGGYAYIKYPILEIANVPILWLPYLIIPLRSERQTGFLIPSFDYSGADGFVFGQRFFWAIDRSQDATFTVKDYSRRGLKGLVNYRYMLSDKSFGELNSGLILNDQIFATQEVPGPVGTKSNRWFTTYEHSYDLPYDISQKAKLNLVSDLFYPRDFLNEMSGRGDPALENKLSVSRDTFHTHSSIEAVYYLNMLKSNPIDSNDDAVHRWPEIRFNSVDQPVLGTNLLFRFNADYVNFSRDGLGYDNVIQAVPTSANPYTKQIDLGRNGVANSTDANGNPVRVNTNQTGGNYGGVFNPATDLVRTGQRLDLSPEIAYPFAIGPYLDVLPTLQYHHTQYAFNVSAPTSLPDGTPAMQYDTTPYRSYAFATLSARTRFYRVYGGGDGSDEPSVKRPEPPAPSTSWVDAESRLSEADSKSLKVPERAPIYRHEFIPEIVATYLPYVNQPSNHPFFNQGGTIPSFLDQEPIDNNNFFSPPSPTAPPSPIPAPGQAVSTPQSIQFDYYDRLNTQTTVSAVMTNRLVRKRYRSGTPEYQQIASWRLAESYDFAEASRNDDPKLPYSDVSSLLDVHLDRVDMNSLVRYFPYHKVTDTVSYIKFKNESGRNFVGASFTRSYAISRYVQNTLLNPDDFAISTGVVSKYVDIVGSLDYLPQNFGPLDFRLKSWSTDYRIRPPGNCWVFKLHYEQTFEGNTFFGVDFEYNFGGAST